MPVCMGEQVFFVQDNDNPYWSVVIQKEPRSRRVEDESEDIVIGASGLATSVTVDKVGAGYNDIPGADRGINVPIQEVVLADAERESDESANHFEDMDHEDEDDDDEVNIHQERGARVEYADVQ